MLVFPNYTLNIAAVNFSFFLIVRNGKIQDGIDYLMLQEIFKTKNLQYKLTLFPEWDMALTAMENGSYDLAIGAYWKKAVAQKNLDMSFAYVECCQTVLVAKPKLLPQETYVFQPLTLTLWSLYFTTCILVALLLKYIHHTIEELLKFSDIILQIISLATTSGTDVYIKSKAKGAKLLKIIISALSLIIFSAYESGFTSSLASPRYEKSIKLIEDLVANKIRYAHVRGNELIEWSRSPNENIRRFVENYVLIAEDQLDSFENPLAHSSCCSSGNEKLPKIASDNLKFVEMSSKNNLKVLVKAGSGKKINSNDDASVQNLTIDQFTHGKKLIPKKEKINLINSNKFAFSAQVVQSYVLETSDEYKGDRLKVLSECLDVNDYVWAFPKNSKIKNRIDVDIKRFLEHGFLHVWFTRMRVKYGSRNTGKFFSEIEGEISTKPHPLTLIRIQGVFYLLIFGYVLSGLTFMWERFRVWNGSKIELVHL